MTPLRWKAMLALLALILVVLVLSPFRRRIFISSSSTVINARTPRVGVKIKAYRSLEGEILLDVQESNARALYLIVPSTQLILIPSHNAVLQIAGLMVSKEPQIGGVSLKKAEILEMPIWSTQSLRFTGLRGVDIEVNWKSGVQGKSAFNGFQR